MKILALSDRPPHMSVAGTLRDLCEREGIELICTLGDLEYSDIQELVDITNIPKFGVYGNHCSGTYMDELGISNMHLRTMQYGGLSFGGFEGCVRYKAGSAPMYAQEEAQALMQNFPYVDIFLSHAPPYGIDDDPTEVTHQGFIALREYLDRLHPKLWMHGHTYPAPESLVTQHGSTRVEYIFGHKIIQI